RHCSHTAHLDPRHGAEPSIAARQVLRGQKTQPAPEITADLANAMFAAAPRATHRLAQLWLIIPNSKRSAPVYLRTCSRAAGASATLGSSPVPRAPSWSTRCTTWP